MAQVDTTNTEKFHSKKERGKYKLTFSNFLPELQKERIDGTGQTSQRVTFYRMLFCIPLGSRERKTHMR